MLRKHLHNTSPLRVALRADRWEGHKGEGFAKADDLSVDNPADESEPDKPQEQSF